MAANYPGLTLAFSQRSAGFACAALGALGFSFKAILVKAAYRYGVDAETLLCLRMGYSLPPLVAMAVLLQRRAPLALRARDWRELALLGVLGYYVASYLDFLGLRHISPGLELLLVASWLGVALAVAPNFRFAAGETALGGMLVLGSALSYAIYLMRSGEAVLRLGSTRVTAYATSIASVLCVLQLIALRPLSALIQPWQVHALSIAMALFSTVLPIWLVTEAVRRLGAPLASMFGSLGPIITMLLAYALLQEPIDAAQLAGAAIVIAAVSRLTRA